MSNKSKCEMARLRYCQKTYFGYCNADDKEIERCPYLKAIEEIAKLANEMIEFIEKTERFFDCPEEYESYFGFERKWDEGTGEILEATREYYDRGGRFVNIPDKFPCVIYFGIVDFNAVMPNIEKLDWIYIE